MAPSLDRDRGPLPVFEPSSMSPTCSKRIGAHARRRLPAARATVAASLALLALHAAVAGAASARARAHTSAHPHAAATMLIEGAGEGHGVGMSQDGAYGYALSGWSYQQILAHYYTGTTLGLAPPNATVRVLVGSRVLKLPLERYVRRVIAREMPSQWPAAALQAQAIASRTYALTAHAGGARFDVYADTRSQVYGGAAAETSPTNTAVAATAGQIVLYAGRPATTYFFASSGGVTEDIENSFLGSAPEPWLRGVPDPYDAGPSSRWRRSMSFKSAAARLRGLVKGAFRGIEVLRRGASPRVVSALVLGSRGTTPVSGPTLAARLALKSTWAYFSVRRGATLRREPDRSGAAPATPLPAAAGTTRAPTGKQGGAQAPGASGPASAAGGVAAG